MAAKKEQPKQQPKTGKLTRQDSADGVIHRKEQASVPSGREADESTRGAKPVEQGTGDKKK